MDFLLTALVGSAVIGQLVTARTGLDWAALAVVAVLGAAGYFLVRSSQQLRSSRKLFETAAELAWGEGPAFASSRKGSLVEASGRVVVQSPVPGPFSGEMAAFWQCRVQEKTPGGWRTLHESHSQDEFLLENGGFRVAVLPEHAEIRLDSEPYVFMQKDGDASLPVHLNEFLHSRGLNAPDGSAALRFLEWRVNDGDTLSALGRMEPVSANRGLLGGLYPFEGGFWLANRSPRKLFRPKGADRFGLGVGLMLAATLLGSGSAWRGWAALKSAPAGVEAAAENR